MGRRKGKKGRAARNARRSLGNAEPEELVKAPHSFVIGRGHLGKHGTELMLNFRKVMEPFTASQLKVRKNNVLKDFIHIAGPLNVTHLIMFTKSAIALYMRVIRLPRGPTLTFRIHEYSLVRDVISSMKKAIMYDKLFDHHPLLVLNNFTGEGLHFKLMSAMFQGMFPSINVNKANLNAIRRCLLMNYNADKTIDLRQYTIKVVPCGMSKAVKKIVQSKVPDLGNYDDISEYMMKAGNLSESEAEMDGPLNQVVLPQPISSRGNIKSQKSAVRLYEIGPRMKLQLIKIEEGVVSGDVLFHEYIAKTPEEIAAIKARKRKLMQLKAQRRAIQEQNVRRKQQMKEKAKEAGSKTSEEMQGTLEDTASSKKKRKQTDDVEVPGKRRKLSEENSSAEQSGKKKPQTLQDLLARRKKRKLAKLRRKKAKRKGKMKAKKKAK